MEDLGNDIDVEIVSAKFSNNSEEEKDMQMSCNGSFSSNQSDEIWPNHVTV